MNEETFNYSSESLAPFFYLNKRDRKNIYIFSTEKEALEFYNNLELEYGRCSANQGKFVMGDFNARLGSCQPIEEHTVG